MSGDEWDGEDTTGMCVSGERERVDEDERKKEEGKRKKKKREKSDEYVTETKEM